MVQSTKDMKPNDVEKKVAETLKSIKDQNIGERKVITIEYKGLFRVSIKSRFILNPFRNLHVRSSFIRPSVSQSVRPSVCQSILKSSSLSVRQSISPSVNQSISQSVNQSISQSVNQSISQSVNQ